MTDIYKLSKQSLQTVLPLAAAEKLIMIIGRRKKFPEQCPFKLDSG
jgi:hypothetical protein